MFDLVPFRRRGNREIRSLEDPFNLLWPNFFSDFMDVANVGFKTDVKETENEYIIQAELPGFSKDNINIELSENYLTISATNDQVVEEEKENYIRRERRIGSYQRSFYIENVKEDEIKAQYKDGILELKLPKEKPGKMKKRIIDIK